MSGPFSLLPSPIVRGTGRIVLKDISSSLPLPRGKPRELPIERFAEPDGMIVVHRTDAANSTPQSSAEYHTKGVDEGGRGWSRIGYHVFVTLDGTVYQTLRFTWDGAHAPPNRHRLGVALVGRCSDPLSAAQAALLPRLLAQLCGDLRVPRDRVVGHLEAMPGHTDCPGQAVLQVLDAFRRG